MPEVIDGYRTYFYSNREITTLKTIPCVHIQDKYATTGEYTYIDKGAKVSPIGSDGQSFVDLKVEGLDGIYRISVEPAGEYEWKLKETEGLKGKRNYEACFEGLGYWG